MKSYHNLILTYTAYMIINYQQHTLSKLKQDKIRYCNYFLARVSYIDVYYIFLAQLNISGHMNTRI